MQNDCRNTALAVSLLASRLTRVEEAVLKLAKAMEPKEDPPTPSNRELLVRIDGGVTKLVDELPPSRRAGGFGSDGV